ncbi:hypothetical protein B0J15DRAFT_72906 [Fusarium solani]|uniref:Uncharacterized protein n=1 Tax=Fusarium solani TaxID=169388 RepID=A0A9P9K3R2_FUSSL|nr:uncharacterized protein B0J15DRAFT_72906 [Fusarium solani]KAH7248112.1 hypothetical protein B0J15DRAFT_72906 [Fusarium solani]
MAHLDGGRVSRLYLCVSATVPASSSVPRRSQETIFFVPFRRGGGAGQLSTNIRRARLITYTRVNSSRLTPAHASKWEKRQEETSDLNNPILGASCSRSGTHVPPLLSTYGKTLIPGTKPAGPLRLFTASYLAYAEHDRSLGLSLCVRNGMSNSPPTMVMGVGSWACGSFVSRRCYACLRQG